MTIIEDAVRKLEQARAAKREEVQRVGTVVELTDGQHDERLINETTTSAELPGETNGAVQPAADQVLEAEASEQQATDDGRSPAEGADHRIMVKLDRAALRDSGLIPPEEEEDRLVDEFRHIKRPIVSHALGRRATKVKDGRLIMVASALSGEGKTFTCLNLALSMARERDISVVLVDADVAKPHISRIFGVENEPGLLDLLEDPTANDYKDLVIETDVPGLGLLPAGKPRGNATELLASDRMEELLKAYRKDNIQRLVLFDSPPLLQTPEAHALSALVGQIALVVRAGVTPRHVVMDAIATLDESKAVNLILNQARFGGAASYYGGYHGYGYGYGRSGGDSAETSARGV